MAAEQIARNPASINWTLLATLAVGVVGAVALLRLRSDATKGFLGFVALCAAVAGGMAVSDTALPAEAVAGSPVTVDAAWDVPRRAFLALFGAGAMVCSFVLLRGGRAAPLAIGTAAAGAALQTVTTRSMESAAGLLYINVAPITAGTIAAAGLYFGAGLLV